MLGADEKLYREAVVGERRKMKYVKNLFACGEMGLGERIKMRHDRFYEF